MDDNAQNQCAVDRIQHIPDRQLTGESGKMVFLVELLDNLKADGHRCLVFSQSRKVLDIIQKVVRQRVSRLIVYKEIQDIFKKQSESMSLNACCIYCGRLEKIFNLWRGHVLYHIVKGFFIVYLFILLFIIFLNMFIQHKPFCLAKVSDSTGNSL